jgi:hypothetical protein
MQRWKVHLPRELRSLHRPRLLLPSTAQQAQLHGANGTNDQESEANVKGRELHLSYSALGRRNDKTYEKVEMRRAVDEQSARCCSSNDSGSVVAGKRAVGEQGKRDGRQGCKHSEEWRGAT